MFWVKFCVFVSICGMLFNKLLVVLDVVIEFCMCLVVISLLVLMFREYSSIVVNLICNWVLIG